MALDEESIVEKLTDSVVESAVTASSKKRAIVVLTAIVAVLAALYLVQRGRTQAEDSPIEQPNAVAA